MGGIVGYVGPRQAFPIIAEGLARLEYRGDDSAGIALLADGKLALRRTVGRVHGLWAENWGAALAGSIGIGHTRWATHGRPTIENAHPHRDCTGTVAVAHDGIIENHAELRAALVSRGHVFRSETDTEVIAHLVEEHLGGDQESVVRKVAELLRGDYALAIVTEEFPDTIAAVRSGTPPLVIGVGPDGEHYLASDAVALASYSRELMVLERGEMAILARDAVTTLRLGDGLTVNRRPVRIPWDAEDVELAGHRDFMHKEIHEQPTALRRTLGRRAFPEPAGLTFDGVPMTDERWRTVQRVVLVGCGTSHHAGLIARRYFEGLARIPVDVDIASEFRYRDLLLGPEDVCIFVSQSGETADTLGALHAARAQGARVLGVCNVPGSSLTRDADAVVMTATGPEIGVASTKTFTAQVAALLMIALRAARARATVDGEGARALLGELTRLPARVEALLGGEARVAALARQFQGARDFFFLGRGIHYPVALEGALKLKEIAGVRAEAFPAGEMKHGPLALVDRDTVTVALAPAGPTHAKMVSTIEEVKARDGRVIAVASEGDEAIASLVDHVIRIPQATDLLTPCLLAIPLQLFAYHMAVLGGHDVDRPRHLAKSVSVE
jgi:glucosamine--fructose-6-phosphate aminotransferase (isomerizing)